MSREFTGVIEKRGKWYSGYVEELPGVNAQRRTLKEDRDNLHEALCLIIEADRELAARNHEGNAVIKETIVVEI